MTLCCIARSFYKERNILRKNILKHSLVISGLVFIAHSVQGLCGQKKIHPRAISEIKLFLTKHEHQNCTRGACSMETLTSALAGVDLTPGAIFSQFCCLGPNQTMHLLWVPDLGWHHTFSGHFLQPLKGRHCQIVCLFRFLLTH